MHRVRALAFALTLAGLLAALPAANLRATHKTDTRGDNDVAAPTVGQANVASDPGSPPANAGAIGNWDRFTFGGVFEIDMPGGAEEVEAPAGNGLKLAGIRSADGRVTYIALLGDTGTASRSPAARRQYFDGMIEGTLEAARRGGATTSVTTVLAVGDFARDIRVAQADGTTRFLRLVMAESRIFLLLVVGEASVDTMARRDRFVDSFSIR